MIDIISTIWLLGSIPIGFICMARDDSPRRVMAWTFLWPILVPAISIREAWEILND